MPNEDPIERLWQLAHEDPRVADAYRRSEAAFDRGDHERGQHWEAKAERLHDEVYDQLCLDHDEEIARYVEDQRGREDEQDD